MNSKESEGKAKEFWKNLTDNQKILIIEAFLHGDHSTPVSEIDRHYKNPKTEYDEISDRLKMFIEKRISFLRDFEQLQDIIFEWAMLSVEDQGKYLAD